MGVGEWTGWYLYRVLLEVRGQHMSQLSTPIRVLHLKLAMLEGKQVPLSAGPSLA